MIPKLLIFNRRLSIFVSVFIILVSISSSLAQAQNNPKDPTEIPLEQLNKLEVYGASKFSQKVSEAPASISIVTSKDIYRYGYQTFDDILRSLTGFYVTYDKNYAYVGVRGFGLTGDYNSRILLLIDGHRLNDNIFGSTGIGTDFPIALDLIDRVEVVRGPGSSLYGTNAFFAVINVITKHGRTFDGGYGTINAGSRQKYQGTVTFGQLYNNGIDILLAGSYAGGKGNRRLYFPEFDDPGSNNGIAEDADTDRSASVFANISFRGLNAQFSFKDRTKRIPTASFSTVFNDRRFQTTDHTAYLDLKFEHKFNNIWDFSTRTFVDMYDDKGDYPVDNSTGGDPQIIINKDYASGRWWGGEAQVTRRIAGKHHVIAGTEWRYSFRANQLNYDEDEYFLYLDKRLTTTEIATFIQGEYAIRENFLLSTGLRYDHYSTFGSSTNPRFALVYSPWEKTTVKALYGHAFRAPNLFELYYQDGISSKANPQLHPESIRTLELVLEQHIGRKFRAAGSVYSYRVRQQITQAMDPDDGFIVFANSGRIRAQGLELDLEAKDVCGIDTRVSYALQETKSITTGAFLVNSPRYIAQLNLFVPLFGVKGGAGLEARYMSSRKTLNNGEVGSFGLINITGFYRKLPANLELSAGIFNIFNKQHSDPGGAEHIQDALKQDGRTFWVRLGYGFLKR
jgi:iron complex outermembrane receptor protein